jgi:hypothetical protein
MEYEISAAFLLYNFDFDPDEITNLLKISPTKVKRIGDLINPKGTRRYTHNSWRIESKLQKSDGLEEHINSIFEQLQPSWQSLASLCSQYEAEISCIIYINSEQIPAIHFSKDIIRKVHELNAEIDVDLYILLGEDNEK